MANEVTSPESHSGDIQASGSSIWVRGLYMLLFILIARLAELVVGLVAVVQFILKAATNSTNDNLTKFGRQLSQYLYDIVQFQTFNSEEKPFPFKSWTDNK